MGVCLFLAFLFCLFNLGSLLHLFLGLLIYLFLLPVFGFSFILFRERGGGVHVFGFSPANFPISNSVFPELFSLCVITLLAF